jgi:signal transduction histidine kinase
MQSLSPDELALDVVDQFRLDLAGNDHTVSVETSAQAAVVAGDREALGRALWNLLDNAVKYSPEGGDVSVSTILVDGKVSFRVSDTGIGIPAVERQKIFEKFVRGPEGSRHNVKGTGLGLAMVQEIARAHGGAIEVTSEEGLGSTFTLSLPVEKQS